MLGTFEQNLTNELLDVRLYLEQHSQKKTLGAVRQVLRILETQPSSVQFESVVSAYLTLLSYFLRSNAESLYFSTPKIPFLQFLFQESALAMESLATPDKQRDPEILSHFYSSIPKFFHYLNENLFLENGQYTVGTSTYYPEQGRLITKESQEIFFPRLQNRLFRTLLSNRGNIVPYLFFLEGDEPLFRSEDTFRSTLNKLRGALEPVNSEIQIVTDRRNGVYLELIETQ